MELNFNIKTAVYVVICIILCPNFPKIAVIGGFITPNITLISVKEIDNILETYIQFSHSCILG